MSTDLPTTPPAPITDRTMQLFYTDHFELPLPPDHRFPMAKYRLLRERVAACGIGVLRVPAAATDAELLLAHAPDYVARIVEGRLARSEVRRIGFPWSPELVERSRRSTGATIAAARAALDEGLAANLAGGTHHAFAESGEGYCVFNDTAVAIRVLQREGAVARAVVIDCDVHQGNGTASIFADDPTVFTFSIHGASNFPFRKEASDLDVALADGSGDTAYLEALGTALAAALARSNAELAVYIAGADPFAGDRLGRLAVSKAGLRARDRLVVAACRARSIPVAISMGGGYAARVDDTVDIHLATLAVAAELAEPPVPAGAAAPRSLSCR